MTEYELIDAYQSVEASWQGAVSIFISGLYTIFCLLILQMLSTLLIRMTQLGSEILEFSPDRAVADSRIVGNGLVLWGTVFLGAYVAGLVFMFQVRRGATKGT